MLVSGQEPAALAVCGRGEKRAGVSGGGGQATGTTTATAAGKNTNVMHRSLGKTPKKRFVRFPRRAPAVRKRASPEPRKGMKTRMPGCGAGTGAARERGMGLTLVRDAPLALAGCVNLLEYRPARDAGGMVGGVSHARLAPLGVKLPRPPRQSHDSWRLTTRQLSKKKTGTPGPLARAHLWSGRERMA